MTINKDELRRLAEAATPGPWFRDRTTVYALNARNFNRFCAQVQDAHTPTAELEANAQLIAECSPSTILSLLDELEAAQRDAERWRAVRNKAYVSGAGWTFSCRFKPIDKYDFNKTGEAKIQALEAAIVAAMQEQKP